MLCITLKRYLKKKFWSLSPLYCKGCNIYKWLEDLLPCWWNMCVYLNIHKSFSVIITFFPKWELEKVLLAFLLILHDLLTQMKLYGMFLPIWIVPCTPARILKSFVLVSSTFTGLAFSKAKASLGSPEAGDAVVRCLLCSACRGSPLSESYPWPLWQTDHFLLFASSPLSSLGECHGVVAALAGFGESLEDWGFWQSWLLDPELISLTPPRPHSPPPREMGTFAPLQSWGRR